MRGGLAQLSIAEPRSHVAHLHCRWVADQADTNNGVGLIGYGG